MDEQDKFKAFIDYQANRESQQERMGSGTADNTTQTTQTGIGGYVSHLYRNFSGHGNCPTCGKCRCCGGGRDWYYTTPYFSTY